MATQLKSNSKYSEAEWTTRQELAACYRIFAMFGWDELVFNHITVKVPDEDGAFLINPYGMHFGEITASSLIKIDIDGNKIDVDNPWYVNKAGFVQHSLFHRTLPDAHAIIHTHTTATVAVCSLEGGLQPVNFYACNFMGQLAYHDFEGVTVREEEGVLVEMVVEIHQQKERRLGLGLMALPRSACFFNNLNIARMRTPLRERFRSRLRSRNHIEYNKHILIE